MVEEERLKLTSVVDDEGHGKLDDLADKLDEVDRTLRTAGSDTDDKLTIDVEVEGVSEAAFELQALESQVDSLNDSIAEIEVDTGMVPRTEPTSAIGDGGSNADGDGSDLFTVDNLDIFEEHASPFLDLESLGKRGGETSTITDILDKDIEDLVDFEDAVNAVRDPDSQVGTNTLRGITGFDGPEGFVDAVETLESENMTVLGRDDRTTRQKLSNASERLSFTMNKFYRLFAAVIPFFATFVGALPAAITGVVALGGAALAAAGALGAIGALGAMGLSLQETGELSMEPIYDRMEDVGDSFVDAFSPLSRQFAPVVEDTIEDVEAMAGPLATAASELRQFGDDFAGLSSYLATSIPSLVDTTLAFTAAAMPLLQGLGEYVVSKDIFGFMATQLAEAWPALVLLGQSLMQILPAVIRVSQGFLLVAAGLSVIFQPIAILINQFPILGGAIGVVTAGLFTLIGVSSLATLAMNANTAAVTRFASTLLFKAGTAINSAIISLANYTGMSYAATAATVALWSAVTLGVAAVALYSTQFKLLTGNISSATSELRKFGRVSGTLSGTSFDTPSPTGGSTQGSYYTDNSTTIIDAGNRDDAARQQYSSEYERQQQVDSVFGG